MGDLRKRFGRLLAAHRRRNGLTQERLAERAELSTDMIAKIETGATGARFPVIERLASALEIDPAELFTSEIPKGALMRGAFAKISSQLVGLPEAELLWISNLLDAGLERPNVSGVASQLSTKPTRFLPSTPKGRVPRKWKKNP
jgi:transcriptional regulator with XRE-family HTH domain